MAYTSETEIENYLLTTIDSSFSTQVSTWISAVQKWIDNYTGRTFEAATLTKKFDGNNDDDLIVSDLLSVDTIWFTANDSTADAGTTSAQEQTYHIMINADDVTLPINPETDTINDGTNDYKIFNCAKKTYHYSLRCIKSI